MNAKRTPAISCVLNFKTDIIKYANYVRYIARRMCRAQDLDDLAQEVYARLLKIDELEVKHPLAFISRITSDAAADLWRTDFKHRREGSVLDFPDFQEPLSNHPIDGVSLDHLLNRLQQALLSLPVTHQQVWVLKRLKGLEVSEVAIELDLSEHTVRKYLTQASRYLRDVIDAEGFR